MSRRTIRDDELSSGSVSLGVYDVEELRRKFSDWGDFSKEEKLNLVKGVEPEEEILESNTTVDDLHNTIVDLLDRDQSVTFEATHLALGTDNSSTSTSDNRLNDERFRTKITTTSDESNTLGTSTFIGGNEANGYSYVEGGLVTGDKSVDWRLLNHSTFSSVSKDSSKALTVEIDLTFNSA